MLLKQGDQTKGLQHLGPSIMLVNWVRALWNKEVGRYIVEHVIRVPHRRFLQSELKILYDYLFNNIAQTREDQTKGLQHLGCVSINVGQLGARPAGIE